MSYSGSYKDDFAPSLGGTSMGRGKNVGEDGGDEGDRTPGLGIANAALSQLSYIPDIIFSDSGASLEITF